MALCLTLKDNQVVVVGNGLILIRVDLKAHKRGRVRLHFDAPAHLTIDRLSVHEGRQRGCHDGQQQSGQSAS